MEQETVELLAVSGNYAIVKRSGRRFPDIMMQGDSLAILVQDLKEAAAGPEIEAKEALGYVIERLETVKNYYEETLRSRGIEIPYTV